MPAASNRGWAKLSALIVLSLLGAGVLPGLERLAPHAPALLAPAVEAPLPILEGDVWSYFKGTLEPPAAWNTAGFDDSAWLSGPSGFGYGDADDATVLADMQNGYLSLYARRLFDVADANAVAGLELTIDWDDGFVAYVNGQEVARRNLAGTAGTPVAHDIPASSHEAGVPETIALDPAVLVSGTNVLAVQTHNVRLDSSDLTSIVELRAINPPPNAPTSVSPADDATGVSLSPDLCVAVSDPTDPMLEVTFYGREATASGAAEFTIVALPDTQYYSQDHPATYTTQTQWIVDQRVGRNIAFVTELGDCVNVGATEQQWVNADAAWDLVENPSTTGLPQGLAYGIAPGNHDQNPIGDPGTLASEGSTTPLYNQYFGVSRFQGRAYYGGHYGANNDNHYELFSAGGMDFIALHFEYMPADTPLRQAVLAWADGVLASYPDRRAMVTAHYLINPSDATWSNQGAATWEALKRHHNLFLMLCGHLDQANRRHDEYTDAFGTTRTDTLVSDYQTRPNGGNGWLRILTFSPDDDTISVETYSPTLGAFIDGHADNTAGAAQNRFTLGYDMSGGAPFELVGAAAGASGSQVCVSWPGRRAGTRYEWYAVASDGTSATAGLRSTFTTEATCSLPSDCDDGDACTNDTCGAAGTCENAAVPGCCTSAADCADGDPCTDDVCQDAVCANPFNAAPCDDGDGCTVADTCSTGACLGTPNTCDDGNACTQDTCSGGACSNLYSPSAGCCTGSDDCDDGVLCSADACVLGDCVNTAEANCCDTDPQCDDGNVCTLDTCGSLDAAALTLNGTSQYVTMGAAPGLALAQFTLETWFNWSGGGATTSTGSNGLTSAIPLVSKGRGEAEGSNVDLNYFLGIQGGKLAADFEEGVGGTGPLGNNHPVIAATTITPNVWHHAAATYDGTTWKLYLDGVLDATLAVGQPVRSDSIQHFGLGTAMTSTGAAAGFFAGRLDEVRVWSHARTQAELLADLGREVEAAPGLVGRFGLDEGAGATAADSTVPAENGTLTGGPAWSSAALVDLGTPNVCRSVPITDPALGCCDAAADCADGDPCTTDACSSNECGHAAIPGCVACASDLGCDDASACTTDSCDTANDAALVLNGTSQYATMGAASGLGSATFTLELWFKRTGTGTATSTGSGGVSAVPLVTKGRAEADASLVDMNYFLGLDGTGRLVADYEEGTGQASPGLNHPVTGATVVTTNVWHHAAATFDGTTWRLYLDGALDGTLVVGANRLPQWASTQHFGIGTAMTSAGAAAGFFAGNVDEVRVWNVARSQLELQAGSVHEIVSAAGLIGRWGLNAGSGTSAADSTTPAENGGLVGAPAWTVTDLPTFGDDSCDFTPLPAGTSCADGDACNGSEVCDGAGQCESGTSLDCDDLDPCTADSCEAAGGCAHVLLTADFDHDSLPDCSDPDDDGDGEPDTSDCAPFEPAFSREPGLVGATLRFASAGGPLAWVPVAQATVYNVYRGSAGAGEPFAYDHTCLVAASIERQASDADTPPAGGLFYYLVGAVNACGGDQLGSSSDGVPRPNGAPCAP